VDEGGLIPTDRWATPSKSTRKNMLAVPLAVVPETEKKTSKTELLFWTMTSVVKKLVKDALDVDVSTVI
jgi:hypothetical protein